MKAIRVHETGGPEKLVPSEIATPQPGPAEALVKIAASGVNFIDVYHRTGLYKLPIPFTPGMEGAGTVEAIGSDVRDIEVGARVAWAMTIGSYAEYAVLPSAKLVRVPDEVDLQEAAASMLQGMTAHYLTHSTYEVKKGDTVLVHAAAGGAGLWLVQMAKARGARVIGTVSTEEKAALARDHGADELIRYTEQDFEAEVKRITGGRGVDVVYDSVGKTTFEKSLNCLRPRGVLALFGQSSGNVEPLDPAVLNQKGSVFLTRPSLGHYLLNRDELVWRANDVLHAVASGRIRVCVDRTYPLEQAADAHRALESRQTKGKLLLLAQ